MDPESKRIRKLYEGGKEIKQIASELSIDPTEVYNRLKESGAKLRRGGWRPGAGRNNHTVRALPPPEITAETAETAKVIYGNIDTAIPKAIQTLINALEAERVSFGGVCVPDWDARIMAAKILLGKRIPDVKAVEISREEDKADNGRLEDLTDEELWERLTEKRDSGRAVKEESQEEP